MVVRVEEFVDPCLVLLATSDKIVDDAAQGVAIELALASWASVRKRRVHVLG